MRLYNLTMIFLRITLEIILFVAFSALTALLIKTRLDISMYVAYFPVVIICFALYLVFMSKFSYEHKKVKEAIYSMSLNMSPWMMEHRIQYILLSCWFTIFSLFAICFTFFEILQKN
jgi:ABC-type transport system involved in cytochrome c biogenesis permease subunit